MRPNYGTEVLIIGAGLSGLAAAKELRARNIAVTLLEASDRIAAPWRGRHPKLRLNIHRHFAKLPGVIRIKGKDTFLRRDQVVEYLDTYARDLDAPIHLETSVLSVCRDGSGWHVETTKGGYTCAHLIVATGRERVPDIPLWPGMDRFGGTIIHSVDFADPSCYDGKKVLVIGAGNSGSDVLNHLSRSKPARVWISVRHGPAILPTRILGFPMHRMANLFTSVPRWSLDPIIAGMQRLCFGNLRRFGLREHAMGGGSRLLKENITPALDDGFVAAIKSGKFMVVGETIGYSETSIELADGRHIQPDVVICATGYSAGLEDMFGPLGALDQKGYPRFPAGQKDAQNPGLWFIGYGVTFQGFFYAAGVGARRIAGGIAAQMRHPSTPPPHHNLEKVKTPPRFSASGVDQ